MFKFKQSLLAAAAILPLLGATGSDFPLTTSPIPHTSTWSAGMITFDGLIAEAPCSILPGDSNLVIDLGQISKKSLNGAVGKFSTSVPVNIHLAGCAFAADTAIDGGNLQGLLSKVGVTFSGGISAGTSGHIVNTGTADSGIDIQLLHADNATPVDFTTSGTNTGVQTQMINGGSNNMVRFFARLISTKTAVTSGLVAGQVTYTLAYF